MNLNQLQKHYDQLTPRERLSAMLAAALRGDDTEHAALERSAPIKVWDLPHQYFLADALDKLAKVHLLTMLDMGCAFYVGQGVLYEVEAREDENRADAIYRMMKSLAEAFKINDAAWSEFCKGEGLDPDGALINLPGSGVLSPDAPEQMRSNTLPMLRSAADIFFPDPPEPAAVADLAKVFKDALYSHAGDQSGGWG